MEMDVSDEHPSNAFMSINASSESSSKITVASRSHSMKHSMPSVPTDPGTKTDERPLQ
jgi:hypothetical protein